MNNIWRLNSIVMAEAGGEGGGEGETGTTGTPGTTGTTGTTVTTGTEEEKPTEEKPTEEKPTEEKPTEEKPTEEKQTEEQKNPVNLMDEDEGGGKEEEPKKEPTDEEKGAFIDAVKKIDLGEGVTFDDPALKAIAPSLMELTGGDSAKAEKLIRAYTEHQQAQVRAFQERNDKFNDSLIAECGKRFGKDLNKVCALAKAGGRKIFGDKVWDIMRRERSFANNPDIIERLAMFGRTATDDRGVTRKETPTPTSASGDWRENMYGGGKK